MGFHWIDWTIIAVLVLGMLGIGIYSRKYVRGVPDFLAANRLAGKYLLTVSCGATGASGMIAVWQMFYNVGLGASWWSELGVPVTLFIGLSGFITYRFRETRALTLAQFFEMRYSRKFRLFAGSLSWISGILNYGVFPAVTARTIITLAGFPPRFEFAGIQIETFPAIMLGYLLIAVYIACAGGQIGIMISDFYQEFLCKVGLVALLLYLIHRFNWNDIVTGLKNSPPGKSMLSPMDSGNIEGFNIWYFLIGVYGSVFNARSWQGTSGYNSSARTAHEAQMAGILAKWRDIASWMLFLVAPLVAYAVLNNLAFAEIAQEIRSDLDAISDPQIRNQMATPMVLRHILPAGLLGFVTAMFISGCISMDDTYIHSWGTILVQDVIMPLRKKPFSQKNHLLLFRLSIIGIALFGFLFSYYYPFQDYIFMFYALTGAIYLGGAGIVIIGGLYTRVGKTAGAYAAMISGTILAFGGLLLEQIWKPAVAPWLLTLFPDSAWLLEHQTKFPLNGQVIYFIAMLTATVAYFVFSWFAREEPCDLKILLHRENHAEEKSNLQGGRKKGISRLGELLGITNKFSRFERWVFWASLVWTLVWWLVFVVITLLNLTVWRMSEDEWSCYFAFKIYLSILVGSVTTLWFLCGGLKDACRLFSDLRQGKTDATDDGFVQQSKTKIN